MATQLWYFAFILFFLYALINLAISLSQQSDLPATLHTDSILKISCLPEKAGVESSCYCSGVFKGTVGNTTETLETSK